MTGLLHILATASLGGPTGSLEWFAAQLDSAKSAPELSSVFLHVTEEKWIDAGQADLAVLAQQVRGRPEHPRRQEFARLERQINEGPAVWNYRIWKHGASWRVSVDTTDPSIPFSFMDTASPDGRLSWRIRDEVLEYFDLNQLPDGRNPSAEMIRLSGLISRFMSGGLNHGKLDLRARFSDLEGRRWTGVAVNEEIGRSRIYHGTIDENGNIILEKWTEDSPGEPQFHQQIFSYDGWHFHETFGLMVPRIITQTYPSGNPKSRWTLTEARSTSEAEVTRMASAPDPLDPSDILRNLDFIVEVKDYRPGQGTIRTLDNQALEQLPRSEQFRERGSGFYAAWIGAGIAVALIVTYRLVHTNKRNT